MSERLRLEVETALRDPVALHLFRRTGPRWSARATDLYLLDCWVDAEVEAALAAIPPCPWEIVVVDGVCSASSEVAGTALEAALAAAIEALARRGDALVDGWEALGRALGATSEPAAVTAIPSLRSLTLRQHLHPVTVELLREIPGEGTDDRRLRTAVAVSTFDGAIFALCAAELPLRRRPAIAASPSEPGPPIAGKLIAWGGARADLVRRVQPLAPLVDGCSPEAVVAADGALAVLLPGLVVDGARVSAAAELAVRLVTPASVAVGPYR